MTGSASDDVLNGRGGNDTLYGGAGNDRLSGDVGANVLEGGAGNDTLVGYTDDTASYASASGGVVVNLGISGAQDTGSAGIDTLVYIPNLRGSAFADRLTGTSWMNKIEGGGGDDTLDGGTGSYDVLVYTNAPGGVAVNLSPSGPQNTLSCGVDTVVNFEWLTGSQFSDQLTGNDLRNSIEGNSGNDTLVGLAGDDTLYGDDGNDWLQGGDGNDFLYDPIGNDTFDGGASLDIAIFLGAPASVSIDLSIVGPQDTGGAGVDTLISIEEVWGSGYADTLVGSENFDRLDGKDGPDRIEGRNGDDFLNGDKGRDTLTGGDGNDSLLGGYAWFQGNQIRIDADGDIMRGGNGDDHYSVTINSKDLYYLD